MRGVPSCILEDHHDLGPSSGGASHLRCCKCQGWNTCQYCCWAFPVEQGIWMDDWDVDLVDRFGTGGAFPAAREAAATPVTRAMLDICSSDVELPFSGSPKTMARLLDIAILTGNQKAAVNLSKQCQLLPLRRWGMCYSHNCWWEAARTALWAGADFQDLMVPDPFELNDSEGVPFPQALFLESKLEVWQEIRHLLPQRHGLWRPTNLALGDFFLEGPPDEEKLSLDKIHAAEDAGVDIQFCTLPVFEENNASYIESIVTLLDFAIWRGQLDCAEACLARGIELKDDDRTLAWHKQILRGESLSLRVPYLYFLALNVVPSEAQIAVAAAGRASLKISLKSESSQKGIVLYQMMLKMFKGRSFPMALVQEILQMSMPLPKIIDRLDLCEHVGDWMASMCGGPFAPAINGWCDWNGCGRRDGWVC